MFRLVRFIFFDLGNSSLEFSVSKCMGLQPHSLDRADWHAGKVGQWPQAGHNVYVSRPLISESILLCDSLEGRGKASFPSL